MIGLFSDIPMPPIEERTLIPMSPVPNWHGIEPRKSSRRLADIRGPELINNDLIYGQFGIMVFDYDFFQNDIHYKFSHN